MKNLEVISADRFQDMKMRRKISSGIIFLCGIILFTAVISSGCITNSPILLSDKLAGLDHVVSVEKIADCDDERYAVIFEVPLDWGNPSLGSMPLKTVVIPADPVSNITVARTSGYLIFDETTSVETRNEPAYILDANSVYIENRFSGESMPYNVSIEDSSMWKYLTLNNSMSDVHLVISEMNTVFPGKWVVSGTSKGGMEAAYYTMLYPGDVNLTMSYVSPCCNDIEDPRFVQYAYTSIGDAQFGVEKAARYRNMLTDFQIYCLENRDVLAPKYYQEALDNGLRFTDYCTKDVLFDMAILDFIITMWQFNQNFGDVEHCLSLPDGAEKLDSAYDILKKTETLDSNNLCAVNSAYFAYYIQAVCEEGYYLLDFSYLRDAITKRGSDAKLYITPEMEKNLFHNSMFSKEQQKDLSYSPEPMKNLSSWLSTTDSPVILIYGSSDPWYSVKLEPLQDNPAVSRFTSVKLPHSVSIQNGFNESVRAEIIDIMKTALK